MKSPCVFYLLYDCIITNGENRKKSIAISVKTQNVILYFKQNYSFELKNIIKNHE